jgi:hypothetical protein
MDINYRRIWKDLIFAYLNTWSLCRTKSRDSSVGIALDYGLNDRGSRFRFPAGAGNLSLHHRVQNGSEAHPTSYSVSSGGCLPGGKAAGTWNWPLTSIKCRGQRRSEAIPPLPQYAFMAWCPVKAQGQLYFYLRRTFMKVEVKGHSNICLVVLGKITENSSQNSPCQGQDSYPGRCEFEAGQRHLVLTC